MMRLNRPKVITWWIAVILGALGLVAELGEVTVLTEYSFWLVTAGLILLVLATLLRDL